MIVFFRSVFDFHPFQFLLRFTDAPHHLFCEYILFSTGFPFVFILDRADSSYHSLIKPIQSEKLCPHAAKKIVTGIISKSISKSSSVGLGSSLTTKGKWEGRKDVRQWLELTCGVKSVSEFRDITLMTWCSKCFCGPARNSWVLTVPGHAGGSLPPSAWALPCVRTFSVLIFDGAGQKGWAVDITWSSPQLMKDRSWSINTPSPFIHRWHTSAACSSVS